jgi:hypothetical protein
MSAATITIAVGERHARPHVPLANVGSRLKARLYRFLGKLPERFEDVDPEVFKRVPTPV